MPNITSYLISATIISPVILSLLGVAPQRSAALSNSSNPQNRSTPSVKWRPVETVAWRTSPALRAVVEQADVEDSPRLRITGANRIDFVVSAEGGLVKLTQGLLEPTLRHLNTVAASYVFLPRNVVAADGTPLLIVTGWAFASDPGSLRVIALNEQRRPYLVFSSDTFDLSALADLDGDGLAEIIGKHSLSQMFGPEDPSHPGRHCFLTYDPFLVYHLPARPGGKALYSLDVSRQYNLGHYYGWVGPEASEDWTVVVCGPGKPRIMKKSDADRLVIK
jgi:hypothetical protein